MGSRSNIVIFFEWSGVAVYKCQHDSDAMLEHFAAGRWTPQITRTIYSMDRLASHAVLLYYAADYSPPSAVPLYAPGDAVGGAIIDHRTREVALMGEEHDPGSWSGEPFPGAKMEEAAALLAQCTQWWRGWWFRWEPRIQAAQLLALGRTPPSAGLEQLLDHCTDEPDVPCIYCGADAEVSTAVHAQAIRPAGNRWIRKLGLRPIRGAIPHPQAYPGLEGIARTLDMCTKCAAERSGSGL